jgi:hypothetical protein
MSGLKSTGWCGGLLANHLYNLNFFFLGDGLMAAAGLVDLFCCRPVSFRGDGRM